jgi:hypothetical protein
MILVLGKDVGMDGGIGDDECEDMGVDVDECKEGMGVGDDDCDAWDTVISAWHKGLSMELIH